MTKLIAQNKDFRFICNKCKWMGSELSYKDSEIGGFTVCCPKCDLSEVFFIEVDLYNKIDLSNEI